MLILLTTKKYEKVKVIFQRQSLLHTLNAHFKHSLNRGTMIIFKLVQKEGRLGANFEL